MRRVFSLPAPCGFLLFFYLQQGKRTGEAPQSAIERPHRRLSPNAPATGRMGALREGESTGGFNYAPWTSTTTAMLARGFQAWSAQVYTKAKIYTKIHFCAHAIEGSTRAVLPAGYWIQGCADAREPPTKKWAPAPIMCHQHFRVRKDAHFSCSDIGAEDSDIVDKKVFAQEFPT